MQVCKLTDVIIFSFVLLIQIISMLLLCQEDCSLCYTGTMSTLRLVG